jgi:NADH:ubiquinone reductase (H+-translocating)
MNNKKQIVIIGAGFAGLKLARTLNNHPDYCITLIDKNNYHQFQPLFYQVAMASLDASNISFPLRYMFKRSKNVSIRLATVTNIDTQNNNIETTSGNFYYDYLVIATGATTNYFGNKNIELQTFSMKSTWEALQIRNSLLQHFEDAVSSKIAKSEKLLSVVIVGGGPTGVELSGALAEMKQHSLPSEYPELDFTQMHVYLLEGSPKLLANMSAASSLKSKEYLEEMGVTIRLNTIVKDYDGKRIHLQDGTEIESTLVIWAAGVKGNAPSGIPAECMTKTKQIKTTIYNQVLSLDNVFAVGDIAFIETEAYPRGFPQLASVAIDQASNIANNFKLLAQQKAMKPFEYVDKGSMATVGRNKAVVDLAKPQWSFQGFFAWLIWMFLSIGFINISLIDNLYLYYLNL